MANPKRKHSHARSHKVRAGVRKPNHTLRECSRCGSPGRPHTVCDNCGHYAGREVVSKDEF
ncbi:MAG: 50S ribosomal protein L32 [Planctomycetota bacterium]|jgi:large subunit ribosomal protein L32|nr:50S ribosomal protein L32 [Planctomycetota bacterium]MDP6941735.1 50S ribosomal protein L32 [Planctomycetota bacterium]